jgi:hypothetical protein
MVELFIGAVVAMVLVILLAAAFVLVLKLTQRLLRGRGEPGD